MFKMKLDVTMQYYFFPLGKIWLGRLSELQTLNVPTEEDLNNDIKKVLKLRTKLFLVDTHLQLFLEPENPQTFLGRYHTLFPNGLGLGFVC